MTTTMSPRRPKALPAKARARDSAWNAARLRAVWASAEPVPTEIAAQVGVTTETLRRWRNGIFVPNAIELRALARALKVAPDSLLPPE